MIQPETGIADQDLIEFQGYITFDFQDLEQLAGTLEIEKSYAIALAVTLEVAGKCQVDFVAYHKCESGILSEVARNKIGQGFPLLPEICSSCGQEVTRANTEYSFLIKGVKP
ncbi:hypothetical protein 2AV2_138 [Nodularia phage vB_NpeS-2AV2]|jgi:hypothetical protein|uniref:Uncharacterized protein n=3 Tax=Ravarandavirus TaxID=2843444 RepID=A0A482MJ09_9CAUD|nr:hypothetical protein HWA92_gp138 [Nodularia phage vB_NpeS-2AV2]YP_009844960.1 hypothetical protein HWC13_gp160 [Nodularia phage vB_NspS-kac68v161]ALY07590.1 hypothetical protein 2AV2_138 [Nodularia phage vB_NpeS-2AV2]QBQ73801.1 hypothetical protein kac68v161_gp151 [Nodularia phage vB_NspS-kac68v161]QBQ73997.1 hypothetical protein kac68v162_gp149 [Nodularia phage vB_NspS-kac68v162]